MKHINLFRAIPVGCVLAAVTYMVGSEISRGPVGDKVVGALVFIVAGVFYIQIRLGHLPWFEKKDGKAHRFILWLEDVFPSLRGPRK